MLFLGFIGGLIGLGAAVVGSLAAGVTTAWQASGLSRGRRAAARAVRPIRKEAGKVDQALHRHEKRLEPASREYARERAVEGLRAVSLEALKDAGASNVRWSALREAGYESLQDVLGRSARELAQVPGIGETTAARIVKAARELAQRIESEATDYPRPDLDQPGAAPLAGASLDYLEARDAGGDAPRRVQEVARHLDLRLGDVRRETSLGRWLASPWNQQRTRETLAQSASLEEDARQVQADGLLEESRRGRKQIRRWKRGRRDPSRLAQQFRDRYAECCSVFERLFTRLGLRRKQVSQGQGGLSDEVARRVERFPLRTAGMRITLRRYQEFGSKYILAQERTILGDEMGLGKTMQSLTAMTHCHETARKGHFFVVAPAGLLINWLREIERFTPLKGYLLHGTSLTDNLEAWAGGGGVAVTSYATLRNLDLGAALQESRATIDLCVVDEAHFIKNPEAGRTQAVRRLLEQSVRACLMSGTPMENHPREFLELIEGIRPKDAARLRQQNLEFDAAAGSIRAFHHAVAKVYLRRNQEDVLSELPDKIEVEEWVELSAAERKDYHAKVRDRNFMGMRQAATLSPTTTDSAKLDHLEELMQDHRASGRKVIIFSFFLGVLRALAERFEVVGTISGKVSPQDKQALCDDFQAREGHAILLLQIQAGGQGLNLQKASAVVLMEPQTKPSTESQAIARAHRMGQTQRVLVHRLLARDTCDETLLAILAEKEVLFAAYARKSLVKEASGQATETSLAAAVIEAEQARLDQTNQLSTPHP